MQLQSHMGDGLRGAEVVPKDEFEIHKLYSNRAQSQLSCHSRLGPACDGVQQCTLHSNIFEATHWSFFETY